MAGSATRSVSARSHPVPRRWPVRRCGRGGVGEHRHAQGHAGRTPHVAQQQVTERVGAGLVHRQRVVDVAVVRGEPSSAANAAALVALGSSAHHEVSPSSPGRTSTVRPRRVRSALGGDLVGRDPRGDLPRHRRHPRRVTPRQPGRDLRVDRSARLDIEARARVDDLVHRHGRHVPGDELLPHVGEPLPHGRPQARPCARPRPRSARQPAPARWGPSRRRTPPGAPAPPDRARSASSRPAHPKAASTATSASAAFARPCASPASSNASSADSRRPSETTCAPSAAHCSRSAASRLPIVSLSMPHHIEHLYDGQALSTGVRLQQNRTRRQAPAQDARSTRSGAARGRTARPPASRGTRRRAAPPTPGTTRGRPRATRGRRR